MGMPSAPAIPDRLLRTYDLLELAPSARVLEIGGGRGVLAELILAGLDTGRLVGIDRSSSAVAAARQRNATAAAHGRADFHRLTLSEADPNDLGCFDVVLAVNVNLFWTSSAAGELTIVSRLLTADGVFWIIYHPPTAAAFERLRGRVEEHLYAAGFSVTTTQSTAPVPMLAFAARPATGVAGYP
jgi:SAM-dependent methyltransferase